MKKYLKILLKMPTYLKITVLLALSVVALLGVWGVIKIADASIGEKPDRRWWISGTTIVTLSRDRTTIRVRGIGWMDDYGYTEYYERMTKAPYAPWDGYKDERIGLVVGDGVTSSLITRVIIGRGVIYIGRNAFIRCPNITSVTIPFGVVAIRENAFYDARCPVKIPASVLDFGGAFDDIDSMRISKYNPRYRSIDGVLFDVDRNGDIRLNRYPRNKKDTAYSIPDNVADISPAAFSNTRHLTTIVIPNTMRSIGEADFSRCTSLTSVTIPNSVTSIGEDAFSGCRNLTSVTIPNSVTSIGVGAFNGCRSLTSVTIPNSVTNIGWYAFYRCERLGHITIPESVTYIGNGAFTSAASISVAADNPNYTSVDGVLFNKDKTILLQYPGGREDREYIIPDGVTVIKELAFVVDSALTSIVIPRSVTIIQDRALYIYKLAVLTCLNPVPPNAIIPSAIRGFCLYVPKGSVDAYRNAREWKEKVKCIEAIKSNNNMEGTKPKNNNMEGTPPLRGEPYPTL